MYKWARPRTSSWNRSFYRALLSLFTISVCHAVLVNRTIDSNKGDPATGFVPIYQPQSSWADQTCSGCFIQPDIAKAFDGTWNAATYYPELQNVNVTLRFTGVAVWIFFILPNANDHSTGTTTHTQVNITIDGQYAGNYSHNPDLSTYDMIYNATIFSTTSLTNTSHELVIATNNFPINTFINFDWAIYTVDDGAPASQSIFPSTTSSNTSSFSTDGTFSSTPTPTPFPTLQSSSSKTAMIVGCTLGGLAAIALVFLIHCWRRVPPVRNGTAERILDIDVPLPYQPYYKREIPVQDHGPMQSKAARSQARQRELDERIQSAQRELDNLRSLRNARSAGNISGPFVASPSRPSLEIALLHNEMQQMRNQVDYLTAQRESDWALGLSDELPPAYTQLSNNVQ